MQTLDGVQNNIDKIATLFPNCITEKLGKDGELTHSIDFDKLRQELSSEIVEGREERYQFTWPDKKKAVLLANSPINATLRPCREESVEFDNTENLYIEGDNLDVLKCLKETYLGKVKMIYIDPPYNTGNDFVYEDNFAEKSEDYLANSGQYDELGNRLVVNAESNGRFHTDWLNMIYPRMKIARDLLKEDGLIFISLDDSEIYNMKKIADEVMGQENFICNFIRKNKAGSGHDSNSIAIEFDYILCYAKNIKVCKINQEEIDIENDTKYNLSDEYEDRRGKYYLRDLDYRGSYSESGDYPITVPDGTVIYSGGVFGKPNTWRWSKAKFEWGIKNDFIVFKKSGDKWKVYIKQYQFVDNCDNPYTRTIPYRALIDYSNGLGSLECTKIIGSNVFSYPKPSELIKHLLKIGSDKESIILDFFSGSASTAHAVMKQNAEDQGNRKYILVQLPEITDEKSEAFKAGFHNICEIGKERIRRSGKMIKDSDPERTKKLDIGFRVLKIDSSNMKDVYYTPNEYNQADLFTTTENVKEDRNSEDLLFQIMLELGATLDSKIETMIIDEKTVFNVADGYLVACFESDVNEDLVKAIANIQPQYAVLRDSSMANDSIATNFEQIFKTYSPITTTKVL